MLTRKIFLLITLLISNLLIFSQSGILKGNVKDKHSKELIPFATVILEKDGKQIGGATTDFEGYYTIKPIEPGIYEVSANFVGYTTNNIVNVVISADKITILDIELNPSTVMLEAVEIIDFKIPLIDRDHTASGATVTAEELRKLPNKNNTQSTQEGVIKGNVSDSQFHPGQITATELNDFSSWGLWNDISKSDLKEFQLLWGIHTDSRYCIQVILENNVPLVDAVVHLSNKDSILWSTKTDNTGKAELWARMFAYQDISGLKIVVEHDNDEFIYKKPNIFKKGVNVLKISGSCNSPDNIDIAFVVDATGSMGDEIDFLKTDLVNIIEETANSFPDVKINTGSVFYRCRDNFYVTRLSPLTSDISSTTEFINNQKASEGGDEVVEEALCVAIDSLDWSSSARSRIIFLILDEQPLTSLTVIEKMHKNIIHAAAKGIRIVPVVASAENLYHAYSLEYLMRSLALATNGTTVFLTDHSRIGGTHATPTTDEYDVELLNNLMKRLIYQFSTITTCDGKMCYEGIKDTVLITNSPILFHEVVDSSRISEVVDPKIKLKDLSDTKNEDTLVADVKNENISDKEEIEIKDISINCYPNPTSGMVNLDIIGDIDIIYLSDGSGKIISKLDSKNKSHMKVDLSTYGIGLYFITFIDNNKRYTGKIILTR